MPVFTVIQPARENFKCRDCHRTNNIFRKTLRINRHLGPVFGGIINEKTLNNIPCSTRKKEEKNVVVQNDKFFASLRIRNSRPLPPLVYLHTNMVKKILLAYIV